MWKESKIFLEDMKYILNYPAIDWIKFKGKKVLITGGTGLIGETLVNALIYANEEFALNINIYLIVRDEKKARMLFQNDDCVHFIEVGIEEYSMNNNQRFDYIIHAASPTVGKYFVDYPVETIKTIVQGTINILDIARASNVDGFLFLSSMEAYGEILDDKDLSELELGRIDLNNCRNTYPESKRICEMLCHAYAKEYNIKTNSIRLAQTFGPGVKKNDNRVFAMMARCAIESKNIILQTKGESKHPYLYTAQAVTAIITVLLNGEKGKTYNAANPITYCSIYEMGELVANKIANGRIKVLISDDGDNIQYPAPSFLKLNIEQICKLGWEPENDLVWIYNRMIGTM